MNYKLIVTGPVGAGKTTAVNSLTDKDAMLTDAVVSDSDQVTKQRKKTTTVAMDYDVVHLNDKDIAHIYGTPGQERFDFMWDILSKGAHGVILLLDNTRNYPFRDLKYYTTRFATLIKNSRLTIAVTRFDLKQDPPIEAYEQWIKKLDLDASVVPIDAREKDDVMSVVHDLLEIPYEKKKKANELPEDIADTEKDPAPAESTSDEIIAEPEKKEEVATTANDSKKDLSGTVPATTPVAETKTNTTNETFEVEDTIELTESMMNEVAKVEGVTGVSLTSSMGELLQSTIEDEELNEFIAFLSGTTPEIQNTLNRGKIHRIMLRSPHDDNLTIFVEEKTSLGISSERRKSIQALSQQIEDMLQWM